MRKLLLVSVLMSAVAPAWADKMTAEEFEAYTTGKTLFYGERGQPYGAEKYLPGRRVQWSFLDGDCKDGVWYPQDEAICFVYEDAPEPQCWTFQATPRGLVAEFLGEVGVTELYEAQDVGQEMLCLGPEVGV